MKCVIIQDKKYVHLSERFIWKIDLLLELIYTYIIIYFR